MNTREATCDSCGRLFEAAIKRFHCSHCDKFFHVCPSCVEKQPKCRFCGVPLKKRREPQAQKREALRV